MADDQRAVEAETTPRGDAGAADPTFTTHPTGKALAKDLRDVRSKPERAFNVGAALGLTLAVATFIFLVQNNGPTDFEWLWFDFELPLWAALVGALVTGALLVLTALAVHRRRRRRIGRRDRAAGRLEQALVGEDADGGAPPVAPGTGRGSTTTPPPSSSEPQGEGEAPEATAPEAAAPRGAPPASPPSPGSSPGADPGLRRPSGPDQVRGPMQG